MFVFSNYFQTLTRKYILDHAYRGKILSIVSNEKREREIDREKEREIDRERERKKERDRERERKKEK